MLYPKLSALIILLLTVLFTNFSIHAELSKGEEKKYPNRLNSCKVTAQVNNDYEPHTFAPSNNLLRVAGKEPVYCGEKIIIHGKVLDQNCVPVADAKIYLWQVNCQGKYPYSPLKNAVDQNLIQPNKNMTFTGNGIATTNNKGEFSFITVYPAGVHGLSPHVNVRVSHQKLGELQTVMTFKGHKVATPSLNPELNSITSRIANDKIAVYDFVITLLGESGKSF